MIGLFNSVDKILISESPPYIKGKKSTIGFTLNRFVPLLTILPYKSPPPITLQYILVMNSIKSGLLILKSCGISIPSERKKL